SYQALFIAALHVLVAGGIVAFSSCSSHISLPMFLELTELATSKARRRATVLGVYGQPADHPFPLVCRELQYLKFLLLQVRGWQCKRRIWSLWEAALQDWRR